MTDQQYVRLLATANCAQLRTDTYNGISHIVVPVIALIGDAVVWPMGAKGPELVPAYELAQAPSGWDGRPVMPDHPNNGTASANSPKTLEAYSFGCLFNTRFVDNKLMTEAWLDPARAERVGPDATDVIQKCKNGDVVEVSIGAYISAEVRAGSMNGKDYGAIWHNIVPDHLAIGLRGHVGACSVEMGCGAMRNNSVGLSDDDKRQLIQAALYKVEVGVEFLWVEDRFDTTVIYSARQSNGPAVLYECGYTLNESTGSVTIAASKTIVQRRVIYEPAPLGENMAMTATAAKQGKKDIWSIAGRLLSALRANPVAAQSSEEGLSDADLRDALWNILRSTEPAFGGIVEVFPQSNTVIFTCYPNDETLFYRRTYTVDAAGAVALDDDREQIEPETTYKPVAATVAAAAHECQCNKGEDMDNEKVKGLVSRSLTGLLTDADKAEIVAMGLTVPTTETAAPATVAPVANQVLAVADPVKTETQWLAEAPTGIRDMVSHYQKLEADRRTALITGLTANQAAFTAAELAAMSTDHLARLSTVARVPEPVRDYTGRVMPSPVAAKAAYDAPDPYAPGLAKLRGEPTATKTN